MDSVNKKFLDENGLILLLNLIKSTFYSTKGAEELYNTLISELSKKATKEEFEGVLEELNKKCTVVVCDNQYEFDKILTKDNNTIYLIKGDQDTWFSKEDGDELYDFYGELRERVSHLERLNGITDYNKEDNSDE